MIRVNTIFFLFFLFVAANSAQALSASENTYDKILFKTVDNTKLYLHLFQPELKCSDAKFSAMVFFFGGGWVRGHPKQFYKLCKYYADIGIVAFSAEYRLGLKHGTTPFESVKDAKSAIRWIRMNADRFCIDPQKIIACGASAGGHIAACAALIRGMDEISDNTKISSEPNGLILFNPILDTTRSGYGWEILKKKAREISPVHHIRPGIPPCIVFHGKADKTVSFENSMRFCHLMKKADNICRLYSYEGKGHGFFHYGEDSIKTIQQTDRFLSDLGFFNSNFNHK